MSTIRLAIFVVLLCAQFLLSAAPFFGRNSGIFTTNIAKANAGDPWYNSNWSYRKQITIDHTKVVGEDLSNYPLLFSVTNTSLKSISNSGKVGKEDGTDILFTLGDGTTKLSHELEEYVPSTGKISAWVKIPSLSHTVDTNLYIYYGNSAATNQQDTNNVWDSNYKMVQHMNDSTSSSTSDSTSNGNAGTKSSAGSPVEITGQIGKAQSFSGSNKITVNDSDSLDFGGSDWTISFWLKSSSGAGGDMVDKGEGATSSNFQIKKTAGNKVWDRMKAEGIFNNPTYSWGDGTYLYTVDRYNNRIIKSLASDLSYVSEVDSWTGGNGWFSDPVGIWGDSRYVYVANSNYHCIEVFNRPDLTYVTQIGSGNPGTGDNDFYYVDNLWSDGTYLYIIDTYNNRIVKRHADDFSFVAKIGSQGTGNDQFYRPYGIWGDGTNIYIADTSNNRIVKRKASDLSFVSKIGTAGATNDQFNAPRGMWGDATYIYVADTNNNRIVKRLASTLAYVSQIGTVGVGDNQFNGPSGLWSDGTYLYVGDGGNNRIVKRLMSDLSYVSKRGESIVGDDTISSIGSYSDGTYIYILDTNGRLVKRLASDFSYVSQIGSYGTGNDQFQGPTGIWGDGTNLYIADSYNNRIVKRLASTLAYVSQKGTYGTGIDQFSTPSSIWGDGTNLYVVDTYDNRIVKRLASTLAYVSQVGTSGTGNDQFSSPYSIWGDATYLYIVDTGNNRIVKRKISDLSYVSQIGTNGTGNDQFNYPRSIWCDSTYLYVMDTNNNRVVKRLKSDLSYVSQIGTQGSGIDQFNYSYGIAGNGAYVYIADSGNSRIVKRLASDLSYVSEFDSTYFAKNSSAVLDNNFNYAVIKKEKVNGLVTVSNYINGSLDSQSSGYIFDYIKNASNLILGESLAGQLDELRVSTTGRSGNYIQTDYNNQSSPQTFITPLSAEEQSVHHLAITGSATQTAGGVQTITITATDSMGNTAIGYTGDKTIIFSGANSSLGGNAPTCSNGSSADIGFGGNTTVAFADGVGHCNLKLYKNETANINASDGTYSAAGHTLNITASSAQINSFSVSAPASATSQTPFSLTLTAKDVYGNTTTGVSNATALSVDHGTVDVTSIPASSFQTTGVYNGNITISGIYQDTAVTLTIQNGSINQTASVLVLGYDPVNHFYITGTGAQIAGSSQNITITAIGLSGDPNAAYFGDKTLVFSGANLSSGGNVPSCSNNAGADKNFGSDTVVTFASGVGHCNLKLYKSETASINASDGTYSASGNTLSIAVSPAQIGSFDITIPANATSGASFSMTLTSKDPYGNVTTGVSSATTLSVDHGSISPTSIAASQFQTNGIYTGSVAVSQVYVDATTALTIQNGGINQSVSLSVVGVDQMSHFTITGATSQTAGNSQAVTIAAIGMSGNTLASYAGNKNITFTGANTVDSNHPTLTDKDGHEVNFGSAAVLNFVGGVASTSIKLYKAENAEIDMSDGTYDTSGNSAYDLNVSVSPATLSGFDAVSPTDITSESPFSLSLTAKDLYGNITRNVADSVTFSVSSGKISTSSVPASEFQDDGAYSAAFTVSEIYADKNISLTITSGLVTKIISLSVTGVSHGSGFIAPAKPDISHVSLSLSADGTLITNNLPGSVYQIAVSATLDFKNVSWEDISKKDELFKKYANVSRLYIKFRTKGGGVSDVIVYEKKESGGGSAGLGNGANDSDNFIGLNDGDIVKTATSPDVYIIKLKNGKKYKRLILSPSVFRSYKHLKWENLKTIPQQQMDAYTTSDLVQLSGDPNVYELFPDGDRGNRKVFDVSKAYDADSVYEINKVDRDLYKLVK